MKILVTGAKGQLGADVLLALTSRNIECKGVDLADFDITNKEIVFSNLKEYVPTAVIHCAAYTVVDKAEDEPELCFAVNAMGTENIAQACREINATLLYISTDYVFDGKNDAPYEVDAPANPLSVYGKSKLAGEEAVRQIVDKHFIIRTSWVFGQHGNNFVKTMLKLAESKDEINVVCDQIGSPTYTADLAILLCDMVSSDKYGTYHATNEGFCSWADFASEILKQSGHLCRVNPIPNIHYPTKAERPINSRLSKSNLDEMGFKKLPAWQTAIVNYLSKIRPNFLNRGKAQ